MTIAADADAEVVEDTIGIEDEDEDGEDADVELGWNHSPVCTHDPDPKD